MSNTQETRRHPNVAICPRCDFQNQMPTECLRDEWQDIPCDLCGRPYEYRAVSCPELGPNRQNSGYEIETRRPPAKGQDFTPGPESRPGSPLIDLDHPGAFYPPETGKAPPEAPRGIGPGEKVSDSHNLYRRRFEIEGDRLMLLGAASQAGQEALNKFWLDLGRDLGFVWTTVQDLEAHDRAHPGRDDGPSEVASFTAEVEDVLPASPAFEQWWRESRNSLPGARHEIARAAFEAGSRSAATTLARLDNGIIEIIREREVEEEPPSVAVLITAMVLAGGTGAIIGGAITAFALFGGSAF